MDLYQQLKMVKRARFKRAVETQSGTARAAPTGNARGTSKESGGKMGSHDARGKGNAMTIDARGGSRPCDEGGGKFGRRNYGANLECW